MPRFTAEWLALREPADRRARSPLVTARIAELFASGDGVSVLDLASGSGANFFFLTSHLPPEQDWLLIDHDEALMAAFAERLRSSAAAPAVVATAEHRDLATDIATMEGFSGRGLVTASALLDLVSAEWLRALVDRCRGARAAVLFALTYDGRIDFSPGDADDDLVRDLVNEHQRTDKGFGPALGPGAAAETARSLIEAGYRVFREPSDWVLTGADAELQRQLINGWAEAATAISPDREPVAARWRERRLAHVDAGRSELVVGHEDLAAALSSV
jgi:hypothetical protein